MLNNIKHFSTGTHSSHNTLYTPNEEGGYMHCKVRLSIERQVDSLTAGLCVALGLSPNKVLER